MLGRVGQAIAGLCCCALLMGGSSVRTAAAQAAVSQTSVTQELGKLAAAAQVVFVGQIVAVQRHGGVVDVSFRVEQGITGAVRPVFTLREWAGLWAPGVQRYVVGQRVLAFVHGASAAGLSSPVHGAEGLVPVVVQGARTPRLLDVRRVAASVVRAPGTKLLDETDGAVRLDDAVALITGRSMTELVLLPIAAQARPAAMLSGLHRGTVLGNAGDAGNQPSAGSPVHSNGLKTVRP